MTDFKSLDRESGSLLEPHEWDKELQWYYDAVVSELILGGKYREEAEKIVDLYRLRDRLIRYEGLQMHYPIETTADEAVECYKKLKGTFEEKISNARKRFILIEKEDETYVVQDSETKIADQGSTLPEALRHIAEAIELLEECESKPRKTKR